MNIPLIPLLELAGVGHFGILIASVQVPGSLTGRTNSRVSIRSCARLFWVYGVFIVLTIGGFGTLTLLHVDELAAGSPFARAVALFIALFWAARLAVQWFVFEAKPFLTTGWRKLGYHTLTAAFVFFTAVYGWAALHPPS